MTKPIDVFRKPQLFFGPDGTHPTSRYGFPISCQYHSTSFHFHPLFPRGCPNVAQHGGVLDGPGLFTGLARHPRDLALFPCSLMCTITLLLASLLMEVVVAPRPQLVLSGVREWACRPQWASLVEPQGLLVVVLHKLPLYGASGNCQLYCFQANVVDEHPHINPHGLEYTLDSVQHCGYHQFGLCHCAQVVPDHLSPWYPYHLLHPRQGYNFSDIQRVRSVGLDSCLQPLDPHLIGVFDRTTSQGRLKLFFLSLPFFLVGPTHRLPQKLVLLLSSVMPYPHFNVLVVSRQGFTKSQCICYYLRGAIVVTSPDIDGTPIGVEIQDELQGLLLGVWACWVAGKDMETVATDNVPHHPVVH